MIIAVTYLGEEIFQHFGHCDQFKIYKIENDKGYMKVYYMLLEDITI